MHPALRDVERTAQHLAVVLAHVSKR
jgi:hypothetical protein